MADSPAFELVCDLLEANTSLERLEARGTVRLALKEAGFNPASVSPDQLAVVTEKLLPKELIARGIEDPNPTCARLLDGLRRIDAVGPEDTPEGLFVRMGVA
jgi:hypothetical protein